MSSFASLVAGNDANIEIALTKQSQAKIARMHNFFSEEDDDWEDEGIDALDFAVGEELPCSVGEAVLSEQARFINRQIMGQIARRTYLHRILNLLREFWIDSRTWLTATGAACLVLAGVAFFVLQGFLAGVSERNYQAGVAYGFELSSNYNLSLATQPLFPAGSAPVVPIIAETAAIDGVVEAVVEDGEGGSALAALRPTMRPEGLAARYSGGAVSWVPLSQENIEVSSLANILGMFGGNDNGSSSEVFSVDDTTVHVFRLNIEHGSNPSDAAARAGVDANTFREVQRAFGSSEEVNLHNLHYDDEIFGVVADSGDGMRASEIYYFGEGRTVAYSNCQREPVLLQSAAFSLGDVAQTAENCHR